MIINSNSFSTSIVTVSVVLLVFASSSRVCHSHYTANPRDYYYSHRQRPQSGKEISKNMESSLSPSTLFGTVTRTQSAELRPATIREPTCSDLRTLWKASLKELTKKLGVFVFPQELESVLRSPYYRNFVKTPGYFGRFTSESRDGEGPDNAVYGQEHLASDLEDDVKSRLPDVYGEVQLSPEEMQDKGSFGSIVVADSTKQKVSDAREDGDQVKQSDPQQQRLPSVVTAAAEHPEDQGSAYQTTTLARKQKSDTRTGSPGSLSASEFFNSVWHDDPVKF